ncbi:hypothetical protein BH10PSE1_BH10PSE1_28330 [soil metagenome]
MRVPVPDAGPKGCAQRCALMVLGKHADAAGECRVSQPTMRAYMGVKKNSLIDALAVLEHTGLIGRTAVYGANPHTGRNERKTDVTTLRIAQNPLPEGPDFKPMKLDPKVGKSAVVGLENEREVDEKPTSLKGPSEGDKEGESAREVFERLFAKLPDGSRHSSSLNQMMGAWRNIDDKPSMDDLESAASAYAASSPSREKPAHFWIADGTFRDFMPSKEGVWKPRLHAYMQTGTWLPAWGSRPGAQGCVCPDDVISEVWRVPLLMWRRDRGWASGLYGPSPREPGCRMPLALLDMPPLPEPERRDATGMPIRSYC